MKTTLTPKQVARAIGVSESTLKRWCDRALLPTVRTAGGHRRIPLDGVIEFLRDRQHRLVHPEILGLPATSGQTVWVVERAREIFLEGLLAANTDVCRQIILDLYLSKQRISTIGDRLIKPVFDEIGAQRGSGEVPVYRERRGVEICLDVLRELDGLLAPPAGGAPLAMGGTPEGDIAPLPSHLVALVLREAGWRVQRLGSWLPLDTLGVAVRDERPSLFWLSVSHVADQARFLRGYQALYQEARGHGTAVVVGGRQLVPELRGQMAYSAFCDTLEHLEAFLPTLSAGKPI